MEQEKKCDKCSEKDNQIRNQADIIKRLQENIDITENKYNDLLSKNQENIEHLQQQQNYINMLENTIKVLSIVMNK